MDERAGTAHSNGPGKRAPALHNGQVLRSFGILLTTWESDAEVTIESHAISAESFSS